MGTRLWYGFYGPTLATQAAFEKKMDELCREIGDRGRIREHSVTAAVPEGEPPEPQPQPAASPSLPSRPVLSAVSEHVVGPVGNTTPQMLASASLGGESLLKLLDFHEKQMRMQQDQLQAQHEKQQAQLQELEIKLREELAPPLLQEAIPTEQVTALQARLHALHTAQALTADEYYTLEDMCSDWVVLRASMATPTVTHEMLFNPALLVSLGVGVRVHRMIALSALLPVDTAFVRQIRRQIME